jgi:hypothetical protein
LKTGFQLANPLRSLRAGLLLVPRILLLAGIRSGSAGVLLLGGMLLRRILASLILRGRSAIGRPPRFRPIPVLFEPAYQVGQSFAQAAGQTRIRRAYRNVQLAGSFTQADLHARLIFVGELQRNVAYAFASALIGLVLRFEKLRGSIFLGGLG